MSEPLDTSKAHDISHDVRICLRTHSLLKRVTLMLISWILPMYKPPNLSRFNEVSENEVLKIIKRSPKAKSCLLDPVPTLLLKECGNFTFVNYKAEGVFPQKFKQAAIAPLIKKASLPSKDLKNYRLVS